jgi:hypothetical protein
MELAGMIKESCILKFGEGFVTMYFSWVWINQATIAV